MKKTICSVLACAMLLGLSACNKDTENNNGRIVADSESKQEYQDIEGMLDMTIDIVTSNVIYGWNQSGYNQDSMDKASADKNKTVGIKDYILLDRQEVITGEYDLHTMIFIVEMDMRSDKYEKLKVGKTLSFYTVDSVRTFEITAINGQYVLGIQVSEVYTGQDPLIETQPDFTLNGTQGAYDAFIKLK